VRKTSENDFFGNKHETFERGPARVIFVFVIQRPSFAKISPQSKVSVSIFAKFEGLRKWARPLRTALANPELDELPNLARRLLK